MARRAIIILMNNIMDDEIKEVAEEYDIDTDEAEELVELADETGLDLDDAKEIKDILG